MRKAAPINVIVHPFFVFIMPQVKHLLSYFMLIRLFSVNASMEMHKSSEMKM